MSLILKFSLYMQYMYVYRLGVLSSLLVYDYFSNTLKTLLLFKASYHVAFSQ